MVIVGLYGVLSQLVSYRRREIRRPHGAGCHPEKMWRNSSSARVLILIGAGLGIGLLLSLPRLV